jgi:ankyrin repeat protein
LSPSVCQGAFPLSVRGILDFFGWELAPSLPGTKYSSTKSIKFVGTHPIFIISLLNQTLSFSTNPTMLATTPLLLLLDGILSQQTERTATALQQIEELVNIQPLQESPLRSSRALESIVHALMIYDPQLARMASAHDGSLPLHFAASLGNIKIASLLLEKYRKGAVTPNSKGKIPLHYAAREGRTDFVIFMLQNAPETASVLTTKRKSALHFAAGEGHTEIVKALLKTHPKGASVATKKGKVALHFAARWGHLEVAKDLHKEFPDGVSTFDDDGSLPLHDATREGQLLMSHFLVDKYPQGLSKENIRGETPLFPAIRNGNIELCKYLINVWPRGGKQVLQKVRAEDDIGAWGEGLFDLCLRGAVENLDLQSCTSCGYSSDSSVLGSDVSTEVDYIVETAAAATKPAASDLDITLPRSKSPILLEKEKPEKRKLTSSENNGCNKRSRRGSVDRDFGCLGTPNRRCFLQLHAALECGASAPVLDFVLDKYGDQLKQTDNLGKLPLHLAAQYWTKGAIPCIIKRIWKPHQKACTVHDILGRLPLHLAIKSRADCRLIRALLDANPASVVEDCNIIDPSIVDKRPIIMASEHQCDLSTVYMLLREDPSVLKLFS